MNKIKYLLSSILLIGAILVGCTDKVEYNAAPQVEGEGVYFSKDQSSQLEAYEATGDVELLIYRTSVDTDVDIPLTVEMENSVSEVLAIPSVAKFTKGSNVASIIIKHTNAIIDKAYLFSISIDETTPYGLSAFNGQFIFSDPAPWEVISKEAVFFENVMNAAFSAPQTRSEKVVVEKQRGKEQYRFTNVLKNLEGYGPVLDDAPDYIYLDCEKYSTEDNYQVFVKAQCFGIDHPDYGAFEFGSIAYNLKSGSNPVTPDMYALGSYDKTKKMFNLGELYLLLPKYSKPIFFADAGESLLYLDPSQIKLDYALDYTWQSLPLEDNVFSSELFKSPWKQVIKVADEDNNIYALPNLFNQSETFYFGFNAKRGVFSELPELDFQPTGLTVGEEELFMKMVIETSTYNSETKTFSLSIDYYTLTPAATEEDEDVYTLRFRNIETLTEGTNPYKSLAEDITIDDYVGTWSVPVESYFDGTTLEIPVSITKVETEEKKSLEVRGLSLLPEMGEDYDDVVELIFDEKSGMIIYEEQKVKPFSDYTTYALILDSYRGNFIESEEEVFCGGINKEGQIYLFNGPYNINQYDCICYMFIANNRYNFLSGYISSLVWSPTSEVTTRSSSPFKMAPFKAFEKKQNSIIKQPIVNGETVRIDGSKMIGDLKSDAAVLDFELNID